MVKAGGEVGAGNGAAAKGSAQPTLHQAGPVSTLSISLSVSIQYL